MSVKNLLVLAAAGVASVASVAMAGGPDQMVPVAPAPVDTGVYLQLDLGYARTNWKDNVVFDHHLFNHVDSRNGTGGFTVGGAIGYQWSRYLAAEFGGFWVQNTHFRNQFGHDRVDIFRADNWYLYLAAKIMAPVMFVDNLDVFFKVGIAYRDINLRAPNHLFSNLNGHFDLHRTHADLWRPIFGLGLMYRFMEDWYAKVQWLYVDGRGSHFNRFSNVPFINGGVPAINSFLIGVGYKFAL